MKNINRFLLVSLFALCSAAVALAQDNQDNQDNKSYLAKIAIENQTVKRDSGEVYIDMNINFNRVDLHSKHTVVLTPYIVPVAGSVDSAAVLVDTLRLPAVVVNGKNRQTAYRRAQILGKQPHWNGGNIYNVQPRDRRTAQNIGYSVSVPFEGWMRKAQLFIHEEVEGCASCEVGHAHLLINEKILPSDFLPQFRVSYVTPEAEPVKQRSERHTARFTYQVGKSELLPNFGNNARELEQVDRVVRNILNDKDLNVTEFSISGYASPEGGAESNLRLSRDRAYSFSSYVERTYRLNASQFKINWYGEDWDGLKKAVENSSLADKHEIIRIIDNEFNPDRRDAPLRALSRGTTYQNLLQNYYPALRRNEYSVSYSIRAFDAMEGREIIKTRPQLMSLNEMFLVAQTYEKDSPQFKEVFDIAARLFPQDPISQLNAAAVDLEGGNTEAATARLERVKSLERAELWNN